MIPTGKTLDVLYSEDDIATRVQAMGREITEANEGRELTVVAVLKGSFLFVADLVRAIDLPVTIDFLGMSSYGESTESSGVVKITQDLSMSITDRHVLIVEDIVDTGLTMRYLLDNLETRRPASVQICTLLHKPANQRCEVPIEYTGFVIEDRFVIGYGLDLAEHFRNLPYIAHLRDTE